MCGTIGGGGGHGGTQPSRAGGGGYGGEKVMHVGAFCCGTARHEILHAKTAECRTAGIEDGGNCGQDTREGGKRDATKRATRRLHDRVWPLALGDDGDAEAARGALQDELLVPAGLEELAEGAHEDEPAGDHERVREPVGGEHALGGGGGGVGGGGHGGARDEGVRVEVVRVWVGGGRDEVCGVGGAGAGADGGGAHAEAVLDEGDAEAGL